MDVYVREFVQFAQNQRFSLHGTDFGNLFWLGLQDFIEKLGYADLKYSNCEQNTQRFLSNQPS